MTEVTSSTCCRDAVSYKFLHLCMKLCIKLKHRKFTVSECCAEVAIPNLVASDVSISSVMCDRRLIFSGIMHLTFIVGRLICCLGLYLVGFSASRVYLITSVNGATVGQRFHGFVQLFNCCRSSVSRCAAGASYQVSCIKCLDKSLVRRSPRGMYRWMVRE